MTGDRLLRAAPSLSLPRFAGEGIAVRVLGATIIGDRSSPSAAGHGADDEEGLAAVDHGLGEEGVGRLVR